MTTAEQHPVEPESHVELDPVLIEGVTKRCMYALYKANDQNSSPGKPFDISSIASDMASPNRRNRYSDESLSDATMQIARRIDRCTTKTDLVDFVIKFVGGRDILDISQDLIDDDPSLLAVDEAVRDHGIDTALEQSPGQAARTLKYRHIDQVKGAAPGQERASIADGVKVGINGDIVSSLPWKNDRDTPIIKAAMNSSDLTHSAEDAYFINAASIEDRLRNQYAEELLRETYLRVLLERGQDRPGSRPPATRIQELDLKAMWLLLNGHSSNAYAKDHKGEPGRSAASLTRARYRMTAAIRVCVYVDDLLCAPRPESELRVTDQESRQTSPEDSHSEEHMSWLKEIRAGEQGDPRYSHLRSHLRRCLDVVDHVDKTVLTQGEAKRLRTASRAITTTEAGGTRVDAGQFCVLALELDPITRIPLEAYKEQLGVEKLQIRADVETALNAIDGSSRIDRVVSDILHSKVSARSTMRAARLIADRNGLPDPSRARVFSVNPHDQAIRLIDDVAKGDPLVVRQVSSLCDRYGSSVERKDPEKFLATLTDPGRATYATIRLERIITKAQDAELSAIITTAVNRRIDQMIRDRFYTSADQSATVTVLHQTEMRFADWARATFTPDGPLTFNCVAADPDHNPYPDRISEIMP